MCKVVSPFKSLCFNISRTTFITQEKIDILHVDYVRAKNSKLSVKYILNIAIFGVSCSGQNGRGSWNGREA